MASPGRHQAQSDAALQVGHRACRRWSRWRFVVCGVGVWCWWWWCVCVCVVLLWWCVCVVCGEAWHSLSLLFSPSSSLSLSYSLLSLFFSLLFLFLFLLLLLLLLLLRHLNVIWCKASAQQSVLSLFLSPPSSLLPLPSSKKREGTFFFTGIFPARILFFITVLNKFQKLAAGENYSHYSFILIPKQ